MPIRAGLYRHRVEVQENNPTQDGTGQKIENWTTVWTFWASINPIKGKQFIDGGQVKRTELMHIIETRYQPKLTERHQLLVDRTREFEIHELINVDEREITHKIEALEIR